MALNYYTPNALVLHNTFAGALARLYPVGNDFPSIAQWLADFGAPGGGEDYQLRSTSLSNNAGTDGKDLGVDFAELIAALNATRGRRLRRRPAPPPPPGGSTPYGGTAPTLPGKVEFENYDNGGQDIAYHDTTAINAGGGYRTNAVDMKAAVDTGGGYLIGWTARQRMAQLHGQRLDRPNLRALTCAWRRTASVARSTSRSTVSTRPDRLPSRTRAAGRSGPR